MEQENLTRAEAQRRSSLISTRAYRIELDLTQAGPDGSDDLGFPSVSTIEFTSAAGTTHLDLIAERVEQAVLDGSELDPASFTGYRLPLELAEGEHVLTVRARCRFSRTGEGLHRFVDPVDNLPYLYSQLEVADARRVYACFDQPDLKAKFQFTIDTPPGWTVISNSPSVLPTQLGPSTARWEFPPTPPLSTYVTAVCAGPFHSVTTVMDGAAGPIPLGLHCRRSLADHLDAERLFAVTRGGFEVFEPAFGIAYPFGAYDQVFVPEFNAGAMENAGCVTIRDEYLPSSRMTAGMYDTRDNTILHELAHMWFGDLVTMRWWDDLWLNESFAEWAAHYGMDEIARLSGSGAEPWATFASGRKTWGYRQDQLPSTHPIAADMVDLVAVEHNFDDITYAKGASVLRQLVAFVGLDDFLAGVRAYFAQHAFGNTTLADLLAALHAASGRDLSFFSGDWLETAGVNTLLLDFATSQGRLRDVQVDQRAPAAWPTLRRHRIAIGSYDLVDGRLARTHRVETDIAGALTRVPELDGSPRPALLLPNDDDLSYAKIRLDQQSLATVVASIDRFTSALPRALCWGATWDMCRDGEMMAADYVELAVRGVGGEPDISTVEIVLAQARTAADYYAAPADRHALRARLADGLTGLIAGAEPGSDHQLAFVRALLPSGDSAGHVDRLSHWLHGEDVPTGLNVDADLRWRILLDLARLGAATDDLIAAEQGRDTSLTGREWAAAVGAARPTAPAKRAAWEFATARGDVPNEAQRKVCLYFWQFDQDAVLEPYLGAYVELVEAIAERSQGWAERSQTLRNNALTLLFPRPLADGDFLDRLERWALQHDLPASVRRVLVEKHDDAARSLRVQQLNRQSVHPGGRH